MKHLYTIKVGMKNKKAKSKRKQRIRKKVIISLLIVPFLVNIICPPCKKTPIISFVVHSRTKNVFCLPVIDPAKY
jgi:hypothetical protein